MIWTIGKNFRGLFGVENVEKKQEKNLQKLFKKTVYLKIKFLKMEVWGLE